MGGGGSWQICGCMAVWGEPGSVQGGRGARHLRACVLDSGKTASWLLAEALPHNMQGVLVASMLWLGTAADVSVLLARIEHRAVVHIYAGRVLLSIADCVVGASLQHC